MKINSISTKEAGFPKKLGQIPNAPSQIYYQGKLPDPKLLHVAIIGSRKPTAYGRATTAQLASQLAKRGVVIVSGLAFGVDSIAHQETLAASGVTLAVIPSDLNHIYPRSHDKLAQRIINNHGAIISEEKDKPTLAAWDFLARNRLVSGLVDIVIVTEAALRSGTMSTVSHALAQGREVYALPGHINSPLSAGCNQLIADGAAPIVDIDQFVEQVCPSDTKKQTSFAFSPQEKVILNLIQDGVNDGEQLLNQSNLSPQTYNQTMTMLELNGQIHALGANKWRL